MHDPAQAKPSLEHDERAGCIEEDAIDPNFAPPSLAANRDDHRFVEDFKPGPASLGRGQPRAARARQQGQ